MPRRILSRLTGQIRQLAVDLDIGPPVPRDIVVGLLFGAFILIVFSSTAYADALTNNDPVSAAQVAELLGLLFSFLLSACTLAYSAGWLRQEVSSHRAQIRDLQGECRLARSDAVAIAARAAEDAAKIAADAARANADAAASLAAIKAQLDLVLAGRILPGPGNHS